MIRALAALIITFASTPAWPQGCVLALSMNLEEMTGRAETIFTGECISAEAGHAQIGGGNVPVTECTFAVDEVIRGENAGTITFRQFGHFNSGIQGLPQFARGRVYLILLAAPDSPKGLTTSVALDQGAFELAEDRNGSRAFVNARANAGLMDGLSVRAQTRLRGRAPASHPADDLLQAVRLLEPITRP